MMRATTLAKLAASASRTTPYARTLSFHTNTSASSSLLASSSVPTACTAALSLSQQQRGVSTSFIRKRVNPVERPVSPHVAIYQFPLPAITSITHRACGVSLAAVVSYASFVSLTDSPCELLSSIDSVVAAGGLPLVATKFAVGAPLAYHYINGLRHLVWDTTGKGLDLESAKQSAIAVIVAGGAIGLALAFVGN
mmetsp:Transcript_12274/g.31136  ORF Transcript_12274/g.31136 Transcript_12274/m.31136 type:complete len:195 (+) Transcript_12274:36-620(+)|eukprot:CAMPEP_0177649012 /NCGR_PEP_ID=MMETSP0447-20121125/11140_1 /TAXON_ID=0 /ORGANISM="Stygamoeba regulata, Strain BSH-02190019" /LENGTH=194 /DNA_ID=CAMNT_0019151703 /DNA_START=42 /DNA_END=626 /DNA_ORIENTATION=+